MTKIEFKLVDGEPVCSGKECPFWNKRAIKDATLRDCWLANEGAPCIPGLRQQRNEARAVIERLEQYTSLLEAKRDRYLDAKLSDSENTHDWVISTDECANRLRALLTPAPATGKDGE